MALDPTIKAMLEMRASAGAPEFHTLEPAAARELAKMMRPPSPTVEEVGAVEDRAIPGPGGDIPVRIYRPKDAAAAPVLVYYHGGGWVIGDLDMVDPICRRLTNTAGCVTVSVDYRLAPEHKYPAAADDAYAALVWAAKNAASLGGDPSRIAVAGDSAGGNLAAAVALMAKERGGPALAGQLLMCPVTDYGFDTPSYRENGDGTLVIGTNSMRWFWGHYLGSDADGANPFASPLRAKDLSGLPPAFVITAEYDPLRDEGEAYAARLSQAGVPTKQTRYPGMVHNFFSFAFMAPLEQGERALADMAEHLRSAFAHKAGVA